MKSSYPHLGRRAGRAEWCMQQDLEDHLCSGLTVLFSFISRRIFIVSVFPIYEIITTNMVSARKWHNELNINIFAIFVYLKVANISSALLVVLLTVTSSRILSSKSGLACSSSALASSLCRPLKMSPTSSFLAYFCVARTARTRIENNILVS